MPDLFRSVAAEAAAEAGYARFAPDACLINRYEPGARLTLHQDRDERDLGAADRVRVARASGGVPVRRYATERQAASHSARAWRCRCLGRRDAPVHFMASRRLTDGVHPVTGRCRINLTFRAAASARCYDRAGRPTTSLLWCESTRRDGGAKPHHDEGARPCPVDPLIAQQALNLDLGHLACLRRRWRLRCESPRGECAAVPDPEAARRPGPERRVCHRARPLRPWCANSTCMLPRARRWRSWAKSGSGKSVTALSITRLIDHTGGRISGGRILFTDRTGRERDLVAKSAEAMRRMRGPEMAMVFQEPMSSLNPVLRIGDQIAEAVMLHQGLRPRRGAGRGASAAGACAHSGSGSGSCSAIRSSSRAACASG